MGSAWFKSELTAVLLIFFSLSKELSAYYCKSSHGYSFAYPCILPTVWPDLQTALLHELQIDNITNLIHDKVEILAIIFLPYHHSITDSKCCMIKACATWCHARHVHFTVITPDCCLQHCDINNKRLGMESLCANCNCSYANNEPHVLLSSYCKHRHFLMPYTAWFDVK